MIAAARCSFARSSWAVIHPLDGRNERLALRSALCDDTAPCSCGGCESNWTCLETTEQFRNATTCGRVPCPGQELPGGATPEFFKLECCVWEKVTQKGNMKRIPAHLGKCENCGARGLGFDKCAKLPNISAVTVSKLHQNGKERASRPQPT